MEATNPNMIYNSFILDRLLQLVLLIHNWLFTFGTPDFYLPELEVKAHVDRL